MSGAVFVSGGMCVQGSNPFPLGREEDLVYNPFQGNSRAVFVLSDSKSEEWEKTGNSMVCSSQILEET